MEQIFAHPWLLVALVTLPLLAFVGHIASRRRRHDLEWFLSARRASGALTHSDHGERGVSTPRLIYLGRIIALIHPARLGLVFLALGMSGPRWGRDWSQSAAPGRDCMVVLDLSWSMFAEAPTRLRRAKDALLDLAESLRRRGGHRVGLVGFAGSAMVLCPLTHDLDHFRDVVNLLDDETPPPDFGTGTRIGNGLMVGLENLTGRDERDLLLISDGDDPARDGEWQSGTDRARAAGVAVHVLAIGDAAQTHRIRIGAGWLTYQGKEVRTRLEEAPLRRIAFDSGGILLVAGTRSAALGDFHEQMTRRAWADSPEALPVRQARHGWFLLPAFLLLLFATWRPT